jgi:indolepyruvate decarboxylase
MQIGAIVAQEDPGHKVFREQTCGEPDDAFTATSESQHRMVFVKVILPPLEISHLLAQLVGPMSPESRRR